MCGIAHEGTVGEGGGSDFDRRIKVCAATGGGGGVGSEHATGEGGWGKKSGTSAKDCGIAGEFAIGEGDGFIKVRPAALFAG